MSGFYRAALSVTGITVDSTDFKYALCDRACFIKYNGFGGCKCLQIVGAFDKNTCGTGSSDSGKETQWNTNDKRTRTTDNKECQGTVNPGSPLCRKSHKKHSYNWWQKCKRQCTVADCRGIIVCKSWNKILGAWFFRACIFNQIKDFWHCRFPEFTGGTDL